MKVYITECDGWAQADIEAKDLEQAEEELRSRIANLEVPWGTVIVGELEGELEMEDEPQSSLPQALPELRRHDDQDTLYLREVCRALPKARSTRTSPRAVAVRTNPSPTM